MTTGSADPIEASLIGPDDPPDIVPAWTDLAGRALEPNPFLSPAFGLARLRHMPDGRRTRILVARSSRDQRLLGLAMLAPPDLRHFSPARILRTVDLYAPLSTPLLAPEAPAETIAAMLAALRKAGFTAVALPLLASEGPVARALRDTATRERLPLAVLGEHHRALLRSTLSGAAYLRSTLERRRRKEAERQRRRLADLGTLHFSCAREPAEVASSLERFLALESRGWKGARRTALSQVDGAAAFFREAAYEGAKEGAFRVATLALDDEPIAAGLVAVAGRRAFYVKTAYDETLARFSPGLLLTLDLTAHLLDDPGIDDADSVAAADHPMIDRIWTDRLAIESVLVGTRPGGSFGFEFAKGAERLREGTVDLVKATRLRMARPDRGGRGHTEESGPSVGGAAGSQTGPKRGGRDAGHPREDVD